VLISLCAVVAHRRVVSMWLWHQARSSQFSEVNTTLLEQVSRLRKQFASMATSPPPSPASTRASPFSHMVPLSTSPDSPRRMQRREATPLSPTAHVTASAVQVAPGTSTEPHLSATGLAQPQSMHAELGRARQRFPAGGSRRVVRASPHVPRVSVRTHRGPDLGRPNTTSPAVSAGNGSSSAVLSPSTAAMSHVSTPSPHRLGVRAATPPTTSVVRPVPRMQPPTTHLGAGAENRTGAGSESAGGGAAVEAGAEPGAGARPDASVHGPAHGAVGLHASGAGGAEPRATDADSMRRHLPDLDSDTPESLSTALKSTRSALTKALDAISKSWRNAPPPSLRTQLRSSAATHADQRHDEGSSIMPPDVLLATLHAKRA